MIVFWGGIRRFYVVVMGGFFLKLSLIIEQEDFSIILFLNIFLQHLKECCLCYWCPAAEGKILEQARLEWTLKHHLHFLWRKGAFLAPVQSCFEKPPVMGILPRPFVSELPSFHYGKKIHVSRWNLSWCNLHLLLLVFTMWLLVQAEPPTPLELPAQSGHCEQLTPQGKRVASNLPKITSFPSSFSPESVRANISIWMRNSAWWHSLPSPEQGKCSCG